MSVGVGLGLPVYLISDETNRIGSRPSGSGEEERRRTGGNGRSGGRGSKKKPRVAKKKLHNRFRESFESSLSRNSFQHWLFTCIRFSISIYNAASVYPAIRTRSPRAENGFSGGRGGGGEGGWWKA